MTTAAARDAKIRHTRQPVRPPNRAGPRRQRSGIWDLVCSAPRLKAKCASTSAPMHRWPTHGPSGSGWRAWPIQRHPCRSGRTKRWVMEPPSNQTCTHARQSACRATPVWRTRFIPTEPSFSRRQDGQNNEEQQEQEQPQTMKSPVNSRAVPDTGSRRCTCSKYAQPPRRHERQRGQSVLLSSSSQDHRP